VEIHLALHDRHDLAGQIYRQLLAGILDGRLSAGERLPSTRDLAIQLDVSRKTTLEVFERLIGEGYLLTRPGAGTYVVEGLLGSPSSTARLRTTRAAPAAVWKQLSLVLDAPQKTFKPTFDLRGGVTDKRLFPFDAWRRCINHALRMQARELGAYGPPEGEQALRLAVSRYLAFSRAVTCNWQDVIVTQGAQQAIDLTARVVLQAGDVVAVEDPGYPPARACFTALGAKVVPVAVDAQGLIVDQLPKQARLVYVTPSHQFPLGMPMSLERRIALLAWARERDAVIIEDDYDGEFRFDGRPLDSLKSLDQAGLVAYIGTFSKTIFPELRIGYVVPPLSLLSSFAKAKAINDLHSCTLTQTALARFMLDGYFAKHLRRAHRHYAARRQSVLAHLSGELGQWFEPIIPAAGIHLVARMNASVTEARVVEVAADASLGLFGLSALYVGAPQPGLLFGYGRSDVSEIDAALKVLGGLMRKMAGEV